MRATTRRRAGSRLIATGEYFGGCWPQIDAERSDEGSRIANLADDVVLVKTYWLVMQDRGPSNRCHGVGKFYEIGGGGDEQGQRVFHLKARKVVAATRPVSGTVLGLCARERLRSRVRLNLRPMSSNWRCGFWSLEGSCTAWPFGACQRGLKQKQPPSCLLE